MHIKYVNIIPVTHVSHVEPIYTKLWDRLISLTVFNLKTAFWKKLEQNAVIPLSPLNRIWPTFAMYHLDLFKICY